MYIIAGPPGSGKTTQSKLLQEREGFKWISAGKLLRDKATGEEREIMLAGGLVDDAYVDQLVDAEIDNYEPNLSKVLLDGYPRDFHEARLLIDEYGVDLKGYIVLELDEETIKQRLLARGRVDDTEEAIAKRLAIFHENSGGIEEYFDSLLVPIAKIDASQEAEQVHKDIKEVMGLED